MRKFLKVLLIIFCCLVLILASSVVWLNTNSGKNFVRARAQAYLRDKLKTEVYISQLGYGLPKFIVLKGVLFKDQNKDTLLSVGKLEVDLNMLALIHSKIEIQKITLENTTANIYRNRPDTAFNFSYIISAFSSATPATPKSSKSTPLKIDVNQVTLTNIHFRYNDITGGNQLTLNLERLDLKMQKIDLDSMFFHVKELAVNGLQASYLKSESYLPIVIKQTSKNQFQLIADKIDLKQIATHYDDSLNKFLFDLGVGSMEVGIKNFDLGNDVVAISKLDLNQSTVVFKMGGSSKAPAIIDTIVKIQATHGWAVSVANSRMDQVNFKLDNESSPRIPTGIDYSHLDVQDIVMNMDRFLFSGDTIMGNVKHMVAKDQCGLVVNELRTDFLYNNEGATLKNLFLQTPNTLLRDHAEVHYESLEKLALHPESLQLQLNFRNSTIGIADVLQFAPFLIDQQFISKYRTGKIKIDADITGTVGKMNIGKLYVAGFDNTEIVLKGKLNGLPDAKKINYDLDIARLRSTKKMLAFFVDATQVSSIRVPDNFVVIGKISGSVLDYNSDLEINTPDGDAKIKGFLHLSPGQGKEKYDLVINARDFNAGKIFRQDSLLGKFTAILTAKGTGFDPKTMAADFTGNIGSVSFKNYPYSGVVFKGSVFNKQGELTLNSNDPNISMDLIGHADFNGKYVAAKVDARIDSIDFQQLSIYKDPLRIHGNIHADFPELNPDYPSGEFTWTDPVIVVNGQRYKPDSINITSRPSADTGQNISAYLDVLQARLTGKVPLSKIPALIEDHINRHYKLKANDSLNNSSVTTNDTTILPTDYNLSFQATVTDKPLLHGFVSGLTSFTPIQMDGSMTQRNLTFNAAIPDIVYSGSEVQKGIIQLRGTDSALTYKITADHLSYSKYELWYADIHGGAGNGSVTSNISLSDADKKERFKLGAILSHKGKEQVLQIQPGLMLDYTTWQVAQPNSMTFAEKGYYFQNLQISNAGQSIKVNSERQDPAATTKAEFTNFLLGNISHAISKNDTALLEGSLNGFVTITNTDQVSKITSDLQVHDLFILGDTLGELKAQVSNNTAQVMDTKINLTGHSNDLSLTGSYFLQPQNGNDFDLDLKLNSMSLHSFESIAQNKIKNSTGNVKGELKIQGTVAAPRITGELATDNLITTITELSGVYKMPHEKISFADGAITFNDFTILDSAGDKAIANGTIDIKDPLNPNFALTLKANKWRAVHSKKEDNSLFYGDLVVTTNVSVKGNPNMPIIDGNITVLKGTDLTVVTPESNPEIESNKGIVEFVDLRDTGIKKALTLTKGDTVKSSAGYATGSNINVNITIDKQAQLNLVLDQATGDFIKVRGEAALNTYFLPDGTIGLAGNYELHEGAYQLNYNFIKRKFLIKDGSTIVFAGDPVKNANLDVTAVYESNIAPYDLIQNEVTDPAQLNYFKEKIPFSIELHMKGALLQPAITFDIVLPENKVYPLSSDQVELVRGKLNQLRADTSQLNKQVFAVLILNRFVADDPFSSGASSSLTSTAMQSVSRFIGEQLNQAAGKLIKGVDLSVDLATTDDYTTGDLRQRTDLNLAASKRLMNDRLKLTVGNDFELDGPQSNNTDQNSMIPSNLSADYLLTADGRYTLQAYRKNYNEGVLQGYVTETGLDVIVSVDYNRFKDIFKKAHKNNAVAKK